MRSELHRTFVLVAGLALAGCPDGARPDATTDADASGDGAPGDAPPALHIAAACPEGQAPLPDGDGGIRCTEVGARAPSTAPDWPVAAASDPAPVVYVRPDAPAPADGTMARPFATLADALAATPAPATLLLARGTHALSAPVALDVARPALVVRGAGAGVTVITPPVDRAAFTASGAGATLTLADLAVRYGAPSTAAEGAVDATNGARAELTDVVIDDAAYGVRAVDSVLVATGLTVRRAAVLGVWLARTPGGAMAGGSQGTLERVLVRDGRGSGVIATESSLTLARALIADNVRDGLALLGGVPARPHTVREVALLSNGVTGMRAERSAGDPDGGPPPPAAYQPAVVEARLLCIAGTRVPSGTVGGDGLFVGPQAIVTLDRRDGPDGGTTWTDREQGHGSVIERNARTGVLASGARGVTTEPGGEVDVYGARIARNAGPGVFLQERARSNVVGYSVLEGNGALGIGVASEASLVEFRCNGAHDTRPGALALDVGGATMTYMLGDGLSNASSSPVRTRVIQSTFNNNDRFALVFAGGTGALEGVSGTGNLFPVGRYSADLTGDDSAVGAMRAAPVDPPPTARDSVPFVPR